MKEGEGSKTAEFVCLARAAAHGQTKAPKFSAGASLKQAVSPKKK